MKNAREEVNSTIKINSLFQALRMIPMFILGENQFHITINNRCLNLCFSPLAWGDFMMKVLQLSKAKFISESNKYTLE